MVKVSTYYKLLIGCFAGLMLLNCGGSGSDATTTPEQPVPSQPAPPASFQGQRDSAIYGGGRFYVGGPLLMNELRSSGFGVVNLWTIHINTNGDLIYNDQLIVRNGQYIGRAEWPSEIALLKQAPTGVHRIQFGFASAGVPDFERLAQLIDTQGTDTSSVLYRNFAVLKDTFPEVDAIDFDDESHYEVDTTVKFGVMLADIGFKVSFVPYTQSDFWAESFNQINQQRPGTVDRVAIQAYAGGRGNQPQNWNSLFDNVFVSMGLWSRHGEACSQGDSPENMATQFGQWRDKVSGGFVWIYEDLNGCEGVTGTAAYASAINQSLQIDALSISRSAKPLPRSSAKFVSANAASLSWEKGFGAESSNVYLGQTANLNENDLLGNTTNNLYQLASLQADTRYYWRIDSVSENGVGTGEVWHFTTEDTDFTALDRTNEAGGVFTARSEHPNARLIQLFDNNFNTKWFDGSASSWVEYRFANEQGYAISEYSITSPNDAINWDPTDWVLVASNDGVTWVEMDVRVNQGFGDANSRYFSFENTTKYSRYRFEWENKAGPNLQIAEIELFELLAK